MKQLFFIVTFFSSFFAAAQEDVFKTVAKETCECLEKRTLDFTKRKEVEIALGLCMIESAQNNNMDLDMADGDAMRKLGEKVGLQMASICPKVFEAFIGDDEETEEATNISISGKIKSIEEGDFLYVNFKEDSGKEHKLIWLRYFSGSDEFQEDPKKLVGKRGTVTYQNIECYLPKAKIYYNNKEIIDLQLEN